MMNNNRNLIKKRLKKRYSIRIKKRKRYKRKFKRKAIKATQIVLLIFLIMIINGLGISIFYDQPKAVVCTLRGTIEKTIDLKDIKQQIKVKIEESKIQKLILKKKVEQQKLPRISWKGPGEEYYYHLEDWEKDELAKLVCAEAGGEIFKGKVAVAAVVLNRLHSNHPDFEKDCLESVIFQNGQFASIKTITYTDLVNNLDCMKAVEAACKGWDPTREIFSETGALYFYEPTLVSEKRLKEREGVETMKIGNHFFHIELNE